MLISRKVLTLGLVQIVFIPFLVHQFLVGSLLVQVLIPFCVLSLTVPFMLTVVFPVFLSDITDVAIEWANRNVKSNPHISDLIEIRRVGTEDKMCNVEELQNSQKFSSEYSSDSSNTKAQNDAPSASSGSETHSGMKKSYNGPPVLLGVVKDGENFDFCMCNPPFFETMEEAGSNPKTSCGGTLAEMVCSGGEHAFIARIIEDSFKLKDTFR